MKHSLGLSRWFSSFKIGTQLLAAFLVILSMTAVLGVGSLVQLARVNQVSSDFAHKWMPKVGHTTSMRTAALEMHSQQTKHTHASDAGYMEEYEEKMKEATTLVAKHSGEYEKVIADAEDRKIFDAFTKTWATYLDINQKVVTLGRTDKSLDAREISEGAGKSAADETIMALDKLTEFNFKGGKQADARADAVYIQARVWTFALLGGAVLIGLFLSILITRGLLKQLGGEPRFATALTAEIAEGKLYREITLRKGDNDSLLAGISNMRNSIARIVSEVRTRADKIAVASRDIDQGNNNLSSRTDQQATALQQTAASMGQLNETVKQNAAGARQASNLATEASTIAAQGGEVVAQVVDTMKGINVASRKIADIISVIDGIAFQTNILALNAAVEAARAGEQGRGFAVVASEVRSLAGRSAEAAKEIKNLVGASVERVTQGTALVDRAGSTMAKVVESIRRVTDLMGEISAASDQQSQDVLQVEASISQMDNATQQNAVLVEEMAGAASSLATQAQELVDTAAVFVLSEARS